MAPVTLTQKPKPLKKYTLGRIMPPRKCKHFLKVSNNGKSGKSLSDLPNEILLQIFAHLPAQDLFCGIRSTCKRFQYLLDDAKLWENLKVNGEIHTSDIRDLLNNYGSYLRHFSAEGRYDGDSLCEQISEHCQDLETFHMLKCWGTFETPCVHSRPLCKLVGRCKKLWSINLSSCRFGSFRFFKLLSKRASLNGMKRHCMYTGPLTFKQRNAFMEAMSIEHSLHVTDVDTGESYIM